MDQQKIDNIVAKIAKNHSIILDRNDPVFAIMTAYEEIFEEYLLNVEKLNDQNMRKTEEMTTKYIANIGELAESQIGVVLDKALKILSDYHSKVLLSIETAYQAARNDLLTSSAQVKMNYWLIVGGSMASVLIGIFIGKIF